MKINIGERIKELRRRDGRKQEDLAVAVGVTGQAVSRWESGGAYPDTELIPSIAHYFHISIDELFGYSEEREEAINRILTAADKSANALEDQNDCIAMLHTAAEEYPSEPRILVRLAYALFVHGWQKYGARSITRDGSDYVYEDTDYHSANAFWQEAIQVSEKVLNMEIAQADREAIVMRLVILYGKVGCFQKAKELAEKQNSIIVCRELLLPFSSEAEEEAKYSGEAIIAVLQALNSVVQIAIGNKVSLFTSETGIRLLLDMAHFFESVFSDGNLGCAHLYVRDMYLFCAIFDANIHSDPSKAKEYFDIAFKHNEKYCLICSAGECYYTAPLVSKAVSRNLPVVPDDFWQDWITAIPENLKEALLNDPKYSAIFAKK